MRLEKNAPGDGTRRFIYSIQIPDSCADDWNRSFGFDKYDLL
jgi:hypothetical protein